MVGSPSSGDLIGNNQHIGTPKRITFAVMGEARVRSPLSTHVRGI